MEFFDAVKRRRTCRNFTSKSVDESLVARLLYAGSRAPAAGNRSTRIFLVIRDTKILDMITAVSPGYLTRAPLAIFICSDYSRGLNMSDWRRDFVAAHDTGCAAENIALAAVALGLGSCFVKAFSEVALKQILKIPDHIKIQIMIAIGYPDHANAKTVKREPEPIFLNQFGHGWNRES